MGIRLKRFRKSLAAVVVVTLVTMLVLTLMPAQPVLASLGWLGDWAHRVKLTIDNTDIDDALVDFPVLVYLSTSSGRNSDDVSFVFDELENDANRKKIAVTTSDGITQCYVEIEKWDDASEQAWLWVKVSSVASGADTDLYLYYDSAKADNTAYVGDPNSTPAENVWDSNFKLVCHMRDDPDTSHVRDSTGNNNDGTKKGANEPIEADGKIGKGQDGDGIDDNIQIPASTSFHPPNQITLEAWGKTLETSSQLIFMSRGNGTSLGYYLYGNFPDNQARFAVLGDVSSTYITSPVNSIIVGQFQYLVATYDGEDAKIYIDNVEKASGSNVIGDMSCSAILYISRHDTAGETTHNYKGILDELRISDIKRTPAWRKASYESGRDHLLDFGSEETLSFPTVTNSAADNITGEGADLHGEITATGDGNPTIRGFEWDTNTGAPYANNWHEDGDYGLGTFDHTFTDMPSETTIYWRAYATNPGGTGYSGELSFNTLLPLPGAPIDFTLTLTDATIGTSWTMGTYATTTVVRRQAERYPVDITDGVEAYNGAGISFSDASLNVEDNEYFYRAWSHNDTGNSTDYAEGIIGGTGMILMAEAIFILGLSGLAMWGKNIILYTGAFLCLLLLGLNLFETSWMWGVGPLFLSAFMLHQTIRYWWRRRSF